MPHLRPPRLASTLLISLLALFASGLVGLPTVVGAQGPPASEPTENGAIPEPATEVRAVPVERASPRATMTTFLEAFYDDDPGAIDRAASCLDLEAYPEVVQEKRGRELAIQLKAVLDRVEIIDVETLSAEDDAAPVRIAIGQVGEVVLAPDAVGDWRFTADSVAAVPTLFRATRGWATVEGVRAGPATLSLWLRARVPDALQEKGFLLEHWQWLGLLLLLGAGLLVERLVTATVRHLVIARLGARLRQVDVAAVGKALRPVGLLAAALLWWTGIFWLDLPVRPLAILAIAARFAVVTALVWAIYRFADIFSAVLEARAEATQSKFDDLLAPLVRKSLKLFILAFGLIFIADNLDVDISSLLAGVGIGGIAVALAAQDLVKNLFGSLMVLLDRPFAVGDAVQIGDIEGSIDEVGFRSTRIRTFYNSLVTLPNAHLISTPVDNLGARPKRRWKTTLGLTYDTPPDTIEAFCQGVRALIEANPLTAQGFHVYVHEFGASSIDILMVLHVDTREYAVDLQTRHQLALDILRLADELGVAFAFPTRTVHLVDERESVSSPGG